MKITCIALMTLACASAATISANAQSYRPGPNWQAIDEAERAAERRKPPPRPTAADACGGNWGSSVVQLVEESAANFSARGVRFGSSNEAKAAVEREAEPRVSEMRSKYYGQQQRAHPEWMSQGIPYTPNLLLPRGSFRLGMLNLDDQMLRTCFPSLAKLMADSDARVAAEQKAAAEKQAAEAERRHREAVAEGLARHEAEAQAAKREADEAVRVEAEQRAAAAKQAAEIKRRRQEAEAEELARREASAQAAKQAAEAAAEEASPHGQIRLGYALYIRLKWCHDVREGYVVKYINDVEMERVETAIKAIVEKWKPREPDMDTDLLWKQADKMRVGQPISDSSCSSWLRQLFAMSPAPAIRVEKPL